MLCLSANARFALWSESPIFDILFQDFEQGESVSFFDSSGFATKRIIEALGRGDSRTPTTALSDLSAGLAGLRLSSRQKHFPNCEQSRYNWR